MIELNVLLEEFIRKHIISDCIVKINDEYVKRIKTKAEESKISITSSLSAQPAYAIRTKYGYDTYALMYTPQDIFPNNLIEQIPGVKQDVLEFGKAFACEIPTSCGMLLCRIFEVTLKNLVHI